MRGWDGEGDGLRDRAAVAAQPVHEHGFGLGDSVLHGAELFRGQEVGPRGDQFAVCVVLYELLTGQVPHGVIEPPQELRRSVPVGMSQAVMKGLEGRPEDRHADMAGLATALASPTKPRPGVWLAGAGVVTLLGADLHGRSGNPSSGVIALGAEPLGDEELAKDLGVAVGKIGSTTTTNSPNCNFLDESREKKSKKSGAEKKKKKQATKVTQKEPQLPVAHG